MTYELEECIARRLWEKGEITGPHDMRARDPRYYDTVCAPRVSETYREPRSNLYGIGPVVENTPRSHEAYIQVNNRHILRLMLEEYPNTCKRIRSIDMNAVDLEWYTLDIMTACRNVEELELSLSHTRCIKGLGSMVGLRRLMLYHMKYLRTIEVLKNFKRLEHLHLSGGKRLEDLSGIEGCAKLYNLALHDLPELTSIRELEGLQGLKAISLRNLDSMSDLSPLYKLPNLKHLTVSGGAPLPPDSFYPLRKRGVKIRAAVTYSK